MKLYFFDLDEFGERCGRIKSIEIDAESVESALNAFKNDARSFHTELIGFFEQSNRIESCHRTSKG